MDNHQVNTYDTTNKDGYATFPNLTLNNALQEYYIRENPNVPEGITYLANTVIKLVIDTRGISDVSEVTADRLSFEVMDDNGGIGVQELEGLKVELIGTTVLLTIPNETKSYNFKMTKTDEFNNKLSGATFKIDRKVGGRGTLEEKYKGILAGWYGY